MKKRNVIGAAAAFASAEVLISAYFYRRTMKRNKAKVERTMKMAGTDWSQYKDIIGKRKEYFLSQPHEDVWITADDELKLHGTFFPNKNSKRIVLCFRSEERRVGKEC